MKQTVLIMGMLLALFCSALSASANTLTVTPSPDGTIMMVADDGVDGVVKIELAFSFSSSFSGARITLQGGDYSEERIDPGAMKLLISRDMPEAPFIMILNFDEKPVDQPCYVYSATALYTYENGRTASPRVIILPPIVQQKPNPEPDPAQATAAATDTRSAKPAERKTGEISGSAAGRATPAAPGRDEQSGINKEVRLAGISKADEGDNLNTIEYRVCPDPLQRFREYRGDGKLAGLLQLFEFVNPCGCTQTPAVAISDGLSKVYLSIETEPNSTKAPNFGVSGARFLSLRRDTEQSWTIELIPNQGEHEVVLYVVTGRFLKRIPLVVAPPLALYLGRLTPGEALSPLLEFTIAANYLAGHKETAANARH